MSHPPRRCSQDHADDPPEDNHSGSRLVLLLLLAPLAFFAGWTAYGVARELTRALLADPIMAQRISYVAGGLAMLGVVLAILRWQSALSPRAQAKAHDDIDELDGDIDAEPDDDP